MFALAVNGFFEVWLLRWRGLLLLLLVVSFCSHGLFATSACIGEVVEVELFALRPRVMHAGRAGDT